MAASKWVKGLFTLEDPLNIHKTVGFACGLHFLYRLSMTRLDASIVGTELSLARIGVPFVPSRDDMGFDGSTLTAVCLAVHVMLSCSSLVFKLPAKRIKEGSRIWPEYRLHSIAFAMRSISLMALYWYEKKTNSAPNYLGNAAIVFATIIAADIASWSCAKNHSSTIQDLDAPPAMRYFFSVMQFHATTACMFGLRRFSTQFVYVWIIQATAFLMTLRRKNLLPHGPLVSTYGIMLIYGFVVATYDARSYGAWTTLNALSNTAALLRLGLRVNKYVLWCIMALACHYARETPGFKQWWPVLHAATAGALVLLGAYKVTKKSGDKDE